MRKTRKIILTTILFVGIGIIGSDTYAAWQQECLSCCCSEVSDDPLQCGQGFVCVGDTGCENPDGTIDQDKLGDCAVLGGVQPGAPSGTGGPRGCCRLKHDIDLGGGIRCSKGDYVPKDAASECAGNNPCQFSNQSNWGMFCMLNTLYTVTNWLFYIVTIVVVLMFIYGGFLFVTAQGAPDKSKQGKQVLTFAIIGLAIALLAKVIPGVVKFVIGVG